MTRIRTSPPGLQPAALAAIALLGACSGQAQEAPPTMLVIHGGAGTITRAEMTPEREAAYRDKLTEALTTGHAILAGGGLGLDAVEATIRVLEDSPLFNAGKGAVFTAAGRNELDASIMDGANGKAGAVAGVTTVKNPISAARAVMEQTWHVLLAADGADAFAAEIGLETVEPRYFFTQRRWDALQKRRKADGLEPLPAAPAAAQEAPAGPAYGTVGALALDAHGNLTAGTSTGGMTNKRFGRVGDSPIIGAGTWADRSCATSGTGEGEYFIRLNLARDVCTRLQYLDLSLADAADQAIAALGEAGGTGGVIALDADGNVATPFNTEGMYRGWIGADGVAHVAIYGDEAR